MNEPVVGSVVAFAVSTIFLILLGRRDPKRLRNIRSGTSPFSASARRALTLVALIPGVALAFLGQWWAFLIWLGGITWAGWVIAQTLAIRR